MNQAELNILRIETSQENVREKLDQLLAKLSPSGNVVSEAGKRKTLEVFGEALTPKQVVEKICNDVSQQGLQAVLHYGEKLDGKKLSSSEIRVSLEELQAAHQQADSDFLKTIRNVRQNILDFQTAILHQVVTVSRPHDGYLQQRYEPLERVGLCVPGGAAAYPSTVLMTAVPAQAAGVKQLAVIAPPTEFGSYNVDLLATCYELGITEVYRIGGAQGVAALAYGVDGIEKVDKIVGPGNLFVALAKKLVYGEVDIDSIAGPSEVVVVADESTRADYTAADMLAQAEHSPGSAILVTWSRETYEATYQELCHQVKELERSELTVRSLEDFGAMILVKDAIEACQIANDLAPEHLHIATDNAEQLLDKIPNAGATFLGNFTPVALGDYVAGPSHVLPTGGTARWASGLSANDFLRSRSVIHFSEAGINSVATDVQRLADKEGLTAHRRSVDIRLDSHKKDS